MYNPSTWEMDQGQIVSKASLSDTQTLSQKTKIWTLKMALWLKAPAAKLSSLRLISGSIWWKKRA